MGQKRRVAKDKEKFQQKYLELQVISHHIQELQHQLNTLDKENLELNQIFDSLDELKNTKLGNQIFSQIGNGVFLNTELKDEKHVFMNIGSGIIVKKTTKEAQDFIKIQLKKLQEVINEMREKISRATTYIQSIQQDLERLGNTEIK